MEFPVRRIALLYLTITITLVSALLTSTLPHLRALTSRTTTLHSSMTPAHLIRFRAQRLRIEDIDQIDKQMLHTSESLIRDRDVPGVGPILCIRYRNDTLYDQQKPLAEIVLACLRTFFCRQQRLARIR